MARVASRSSRQGSATIRSIRSAPTCSRRATSAGSGRRAIDVHRLDRRNLMSKPPATTSAAREALRSFAPKLVDLTDNVLFGDVWERKGLSKRDRSLITCATLIALNRTEQQTGHFQRALDNRRDQGGAAGSDHASRVLWGLA